MQSQQLRTQGPTDFDPMSPEVVEDPYAFLEVLRRRAPVFPLPDGSYTLVTRYEDVQRVIMAPELFSSKLVAILLATPDHSPQVMNLADADARPVDVLAIADPPDHCRQRKWVNQAFTPKRVTALEPRIRELAQELLSAFNAKENKDWMDGFCFPLPMTVICELLGLPRKDCTQLQRLSDDAISLLSGINTPEQLAQYAGSAMQLMAYLSDRFDEARRAPKDNVLGALVHATGMTQSNVDPGGAAEPTLSNDEVVSILIQLLTAGQETTGSLIGSATLLLARDGALQARLRGEPALIPAFIEEVLRLESPFYGHFREVVADTELSGVPLAAGTRLLVSWASANRDERVFPNPDAIDLNRENKKAHFGFGRGIHFCLGAHLARVETRIALETLLSQTETFTVTPEAGPLTHVPSLFVRRLTALPLGLSARGSH